MENNLSNKESQKRNNNIFSNKYLSNINITYLSNDDYIKLFYNSKNNGTNANFPLNVIYNKKKYKNTKQTPLND